MKGGRDEGWEEEREEGEKREKERERVSVGREGWGILLEKGLVLPSGYTLP